MQISFSQLARLVTEDIDYPLASPKDTGAYGGDIDWKGKIIYMSPERFLQLAAPIPADAYNQQSIANIRDRIDKQLPLDMLVLVVDMAKKKVTSHEGRHRAKVAIEKGIKSVPVFIFTGSCYPRVPKWTDQHHKDVDEVPVTFRAERP